MNATVPLWSVAGPLRETVEPSFLGTEVLHYSIPALESTGGPVIELSESIKSQKLRIRGGELLVSKLNPRKSRVLIASPIYMPTVASTEFVAFRPFGADAHYLAYLLSSELARQTLDSNVRSVTRSHQRVGPEIIARLSVPVISIEEQRRIADFLDTETTRLDALITNRSRQLELLPDRWRVGLDQVFDQLTSEFGERSLGRALVRMEQGTSPQCDNRPAEEHEWGVLKAGAVKGDRFLPEENKHLPDWIAPEVRYEVRPGDLLITRANTPALVGAAAVVPAGARTRLILCDKIFRVRLDSSLRHEFVALLSQASRIRDARAVSATGASPSMVNLSARDVKQWPIPMAPVPVQTMRIRELEAARSQQEALGLAIFRQASLLAERRQALITAAVTDELDVTTARGVSA